MDRTVLHEFADLAERLGFESAEITALEENPQIRDTRNSSETSKPLLITDGVGVKKKRRCGLPSGEEYMKDSESLFIITYITWMRSKARVLRPSSGNPSTLRSLESHHLYPWKKCTRKMMQ